MPELSETPVERGTPTVEDGNWHAVAEQLAIILLELDQREANVAPTTPSLQEIARVVGQMSDVMRLEIHRALSRTEVPQILATIQRRHNAWLGPSTRVGSQLSPSMVMEFMDSHHPARQIQITTYQNQAKPRRAWSSYSGRWELAHSRREISDNSTRTGPARSKRGPNHAVATRNRPCCGTDVKRDTFGYPQGNFPDGSSSNSGNYSTPTQRNAGLGPSLPVGIQFSSSMIMEFIDSLPRVEIDSLAENGKECSICKERYGTPRGASSQIATATPADTLTDPIKERCPNLTLTEDKQPEDPVRVPCDHVFGKFCIKKWLSGNPASCPTCRTLFRSSGGNNRSELA